MMFFMAQAAVIHLEDSMLATFRRFSTTDAVPPLRIKILGYLWVIAWTCYLVPFRGPLEAYGRGRLVGDRLRSPTLVPFSIIRMLL
jgi:hypothetical protein